MTAVKELSNMDLQMGHFQNKGDGTEHLQQLNVKLQKELEEAKRHVWQLNSESEEFKESSLLLEKELENSLDQAEKKNHELQYRCNKLTMESEELKTKLEEVKAACESLSSDLLKYKELEVERTSHIRQLEQKNDDLERALRAASDGKKQAEQRLDEALEKDALREGEREETLIVVQRLQEQNKDLEDEIKTRDRLSSIEKSRRESTRESRLSVETQTQGVRPFRSKVSRALARTRDLGRSLSCMGGDDE